LRWGGRF